MDKSTGFKHHAVTRPTIMVKKFVSRGRFSKKIKIHFLNKLITASVMAENHVVLHEIQQLDFLNSDLT